MPKAVDQAADPQDERLKNSITRGVSTSAADYAGLLRPTLGKPAPSAVLRNMKVQGGGKGALNAIVGAAFEAAVSVGLGISPAKNTEGGDFDVKNQSATVMDDTRKLFGDDEFVKLQKDTKKDVQKNRVIFGAKNHPNYTLNNIDEIAKIVKDDKELKEIKDAAVLAIANEQSKIFQEENKVKVPFIYADRREGDTARIVADNTLASEILKWSPSRTINEMCKDGWLWQLSNNQ